MKTIYTITILTVLAFFLPISLFATKTPSGHYALCQGFAETFANKRVDDSKILELPHHIAGPVEEYLLPSYEVTYDSCDSKSFQHGLALASVIDKNSEWALDILLDMNQKFPQLMKSPEEHPQLKLGITPDLCRELNEPVDNTTFFTVILKKSINHATRECENKSLGPIFESYTKIAKLIAQSSDIKLSPEENGQFEHILFIAKCLKKISSPNEITSSMIEK